MKRFFCLLLAALLLSLGGCAQEAPLQAPELLEPVGVKRDTAVAVREDFFTRSMYEGAVVAASSELCFEIDGVIGEISAYPGQWVEAGDVLFALDQTDLENQIQSVRDDIEYMLVNAAFDDEKAEIDIEILEVELARLKAEGAQATEVALKALDIEQAQLSLRQTQELREFSLSGLRARLAELEEDYGRNVITAPFSGHVFYESLTQGQSVRAEKAVAYIANPNDYRLVISSYVADTKLARGRYYALIGDGRYEIEHDPMPREEMSSIVLSGQTLTTRFTIKGTEEERAGIQAGMYAALCIESDYAQDVLQIPVGALYSAAGSRYVYVQSDEAREKREVKVGRNNGITAEITEGLEEGEIVYVKE